MDHPHDELSGRVIGFAIEVHRVLEPGLLESAYEACLCRELELAGIPFVRQQELPVTYKGARLDCGYRLDVVVDARLILEIKAAESISPIHEAQLLSYLRLSRLETGLILNFHARVMKDGIKRMVL